MFMRIKFLALSVNQFIISCQASPYFTWFEGGLALCSC